MLSHLHWHRGLPSNGWEGDEIPRVEDPDNTYTDADQETVEEYPYGASADPVPDWSRAIATGVLDFLVPQARAANKAEKSLRVAAQALKPLMKEIRVFNRRLSKTTSHAEAMREAVRGIKQITEAMKKTDWKDVRRALFDPRTFGMAAARGAKGAVLKLYRRSKNLRMSPLTIAAIVTYLETRRGECPQDDPICKPFPRALDNHLNKLYGNAFSRDILSKKDFVYGNKENGWFFHLAMLAVEQLQYETLDDGEARPLDVEKKYDVQLYDRQAGRLVTYGKPYERNADIVLAGQSTTDQPNDTSLLLEVKSYTAPFNPQYYKLWDLSRGKNYQVVGEGFSDLNRYTGLHRQFFLDRVATVQSRSELPKYEPLAADFQWWFQKFKRKGTRHSSYSEADVAEAVRYLSDLPTDRGVGKASLGGSNNKVGLSQKAKLLNIKNWILVEGRRLLEGMAEDLIKDMIENETHDLTNS